MNTVTLQVRLNHQLKKDADRFFSAAGLDTTTAVRMFLRQVLIRRAIPFDIVADDPFYAAANQAVLKKSIRQLESGSSVEQHTGGDSVSRERITERHSVGVLPRQKVTCEKKARKAAE